MALKGASFCAAGSLSKTPFELGKLVKTHGGHFSAIVGPETTHLVATAAEVNAKSLKVKNAAKFGVYVVSEEYIDACIVAGSLVDESRYLVGSSQPSTRKKHLQSSSDAVANDPAAGGHSPADEAAATLPGLKDPVPNFPVPKGYKFQSVRVIKDGAGGSYFPSEYTILRQDILQFTDLKTNNNKYYSLELHFAHELGANHIRIYTHYGRTDDLEKIPNAGQKEIRPFSDMAEAAACYQCIYNEKTNPKKGYQPVQLASSNIGSPLARRAAAAPHADASASSGASTPAPSHLAPAVQTLVEYLFSEATSALTSSVAAKITARGIETPLGVLTLAQVDKGEEILRQLTSIIISPNVDHKKLEELSGQFYTVIPHRIGRSLTDVRASILTTVKAVDEKRELLQLMRDMIQVNDSGQVLFSSGVDLKYKSLRCEINNLDEDSAAFQRIRSHVLNSQVKHHNVDIVRIYSVHRETEAQQFRDQLSNQQLLFHGSRISNFVGLLSRGLLMPKVVTGMGGARTDAGNLGNGIYFGDAACTSSQYTSAGHRGTRFMLVCRVALGNVKPFHRITKGFSDPPDGFNSVQGVRRDGWTESEFEDNEFVIFNTNQQKQEFLVEFKLPNDKPSPAGAPAASVAAAPTPSPALVPPQTAVKSSVAPSIIHMVEKKVEAKVQPAQTVAAQAPVAVSSSFQTSSFQYKPSAQRSFSSSSSSGQRPARPPAFDEEDHYRELFAQGGTSSEVSDPHVSLLNLANEYNQFRYENLPTPVSDWAQIFPHPRPSPGGASSCKLDKFRTNFSALSKGLLNGLDWSNVLAAGGSVLACLSPNFQLEQVKSGDIDLFFWGLSPTAATAKARSICDLVQANLKKSGIHHCMVVRTKHAVTILGSYPNRHIQIVLRIYRSPAEILMGFDIDCCCVGFDGDQVWVLPRALRAINRQLNVADVSRRSLSYELRLFKYANRGYSVAVPGLDLSSVDPNLMQRPFKEVKGIARLIYLERLIRTPKTAGAPKTIRTVGKKNVILRTGKARVLTVRPGSMDGATVPGAPDNQQSDYSEVLIPWGRKWQPFTILRRLQNRDRALLLARNRQSPESHIFVQGVQQVFSDVRAGPEQPGDIFVRGPLNWVTNNPGRQLLSGSFHPVDDEHWFDDIAPRDPNAPAPAATSLPSSTLPTAQTIPTPAYRPVQTKPAPKLPKNKKAKESDDEGSENEDGEDEEEDHDGSGGSEDEEPRKPPKGRGRPQPVPKSGFGFTQAQPKKLGGGGGGGFGFGSNQPSASGFSFSTTSTPAQAASGGPGGFSFGSSQPQTQPASLFGSSQPAGGFGSSQPAGGFGSSQPSGGFGSSQPAGGFGSSQPSGGFGSSQPQTQPTGGFGSTGSQPSSGGFSFGTQSPQKPASSFASPLPRTPAAAQDDVSRFGGGTGGNAFFSTDVAAFGGGHAAEAFTPPVGRAQPGSFGSSPQLPSSQSFGGPSRTPDDNFNPPNDGLSQEERRWQHVQGKTASTAASAAPAALSGQPRAADLFAGTNAPTTPVAKLLLLVSMLHKGGRLSDTEKSQLKNLIINGDKALICALEVFEVEKDLEELGDTLRRIAKINNA